jgi:hypothetical protein
MMGAGSAAGLGSDNDEGSGRIGAIAALWADGGVAAPTGSPEAIAGARAGSGGIARGIGATAAAPDGDTPCGADAAIEAVRGAGSRGCR